MSRLLAICSALGLLCGALGCHCCGDSGKVHGRCDCDEPGYGCHWDMYGNGGDHAAPGHPVEALTPLPKEVMPKDDAK